MKASSLTPFIAIAILGLAVFSASPSIDKRVDMRQWRINQQILLLIENCQSGQVSMDSCRTEIPVVLDKCRTFHVLACDDQRLVELIEPSHVDVRSS